MDVGKCRGNFSSAYKLSRSTIDTKIVRRERRSIEQKELRHEEINKRRNLCDLSPLQEGDSTLKHEQNYKEKTPKKPKGADKLAKGFDRLEQLKKWKQERDRKRKLEEDESRRKNPVFRVSKAVEHEDTRLFRAGSKVHPTKPRPPPVAKAPTQKVQVPHAKPSAPSRSNSSGVASRSRGADRSNTAVKDKAAPATRSSSRGAKAEPVKEKPAKKEKAPAQKPVAVSTRTLRSSRNASVSEEKKSAPKAKDKAPGSRFKATTLPKPVFEPPQRKSRSPALDLSRVTKRGDTSELPTDSFAQTSDFGFSASSFVFRPLSPASAAGFLCPGQDTSCSSFLETNPNRSSTPKRGERKRRTGSRDRTMVNRPNLDQTDCSAAHDETQVNNNTTVAENNDNTVVSSPDVKERSVRRSQRSMKQLEEPKETVVIKDVKIPTESAVDQSVTESVNKSTPRRTSRRSVTTTTAVESSEPVEQPSITKSTPRRSLRRSAAKVNSESEDSAHSEDDSQKLRRSSRRRSVIENSDSESTEKSEAENTSPVNKRRSLRHSVLDSDSDVERKTPRSARRSRRSVAVIAEQEPIQEVPEDHESSEGNGEDTTEQSKDNKENSGPAASGVDIAKIRNFADVDFTSSQEKTTPTDDKKKRSRNRSFGGFRLPSTDAVVLSAKRKPRRKTLMPKSPEEWVEVLSNSPMVEMTRRKHKQGNTSIPVLNFDDIDFDEPESSMATENAEIKATESESTDVVEARNEVSPVAMETEDDADKENNPHVPEKAIDEAVVQVGEVSSTQDGPLTDEGSSDSEQDVQYFRRLVQSQTDRLTGLNNEWNTVNDKTDLTEEVHGQIRTTVGQSKLLMDQRFKQFIGLVDNCEFKLGEKETTCMDLKGFWEMIYYQVEDVDKKFEELKKLKDNNWIDDKPKPVVKKVKKKVTKPAVSKPSVKSKFAAFRAQMKKQQGEAVSSPVVKGKEEEKVFEVPGFFTVASPVRSPKPHCEGGTPKKATPASANSEPAQTSSKDNLSLPGSGNILMNRTPARKSYVPAVPSPLLQDTTPMPRPVRTCTQHRPSASKRIIDDVEDSEKDVQENESKRAKKTPVRRSLRPRKSVNFSEDVNVEEISSPKVEGTDADFARLLQPTSTVESSQENAVEEPLNDSFSKYLQPMSKLHTSEDTPKQRRNRRSSLKGCRSTERRRSRQHVHFNSPSRNDSPQFTLPHTPYNKNSLVKQKRVTRRSHQAEEEDIFSINNIDNDENVPPPSFRSPRPSLLGTPPDLKKGGHAKTASYVPTGTLISFTP